MPDDVPTATWIRLCVTGRDRAKFLHNFCTNDVKSLSEGMACEAFFTDVKARIISHGYVTAFEHRHEIWSLGSSAQELQRHLTRYIITEQVSVTITDAQSTVAIVNATPTVDRLHGDALQLPLTPLSVRSLPEVLTDNGQLQVCALAVHWAGRLLTLLSGPGEVLKTTCAKLADQDITVLSDHDFELLRIEERYPVIGRDLTNEHLAPEAERNAVAISYQKGCYLGQEPIARLDAMGHVNRALRKIDVRGSLASLTGCAIQTASGSMVGVLTSVAEVSEGLCRGLALVRLAAKNDELVAVTSTGEMCPAVILPL